MRSRSSGLCGIAPKTSWHQWAAWIGGIAVCGVNLAAPYLELDTKTVFLVTGIPYGSCLIGLFVHMHFEHHVEIDERVSAHMRTMQERIGEERRNMR